MAFTGGQFQQAMHSAGPQPGSRSSAGPSLGHTAATPLTPNPFAMPNVPPLSSPNLTGTNAMEGTGSQHGGAEQIGARNYLGTYLDSMDERSMTPRSRRTLPRSPSPRRGQERVRSRPARDDGSRSRDRDDRGDDRTDRPVGFVFGLNACETSLRDHYNEIAAHKIAIQQLTETVQHLTGDRHITKHRLDTVFAHVEKHRGLSPCR